DAGQRGRCRASLKPEGRHPHLGLSYLRMNHHWEETMIQKRIVEASRMTRRTFVIAGGAGMAAIAFKSRMGIEIVEAKGAPKEVKIVQFSDAGQGQDVVSLPVVLKTDAEWKQQLTPDSFEVTRHAATE